jgi:hypothetical protein
MSDQRIETISLVDKYVIEERENTKLWAVSVNTSGLTPDREKLKSEIYYQGNVDVDEMAEEVPAEIGTVTYNSEDEIIDIQLEEWVVSEYGMS